MIGIREYTKKNIITIGLIITLIVGIILRFKGLTFQSYWYDELFSITASMPDRSFWSMYNITVKDVHPPLYQSLLWVWYHIFGFTEFSGRALSATIGTIGIIAVYFLGKEFFNREVGLYAAIVASMNYFLIYYSQETRSYSLLFLLSTISYIYFIKVLTEYNKKNFILYLLSTLALVYTHYFGFFLVGTQVFIFILYFIKEKDKRKLLAILAIITAITIVVSLLPLMEYILNLKGVTNYWMPIPSKWFALEYMKGYVKSQYLEGIFLFTISFSLIYLFKKTENKEYRTMTIVLLVWIIIGYLLPYIRSIIATPLLTSRNTIIIIPALILLISYGIFLLKNTSIKIATIGIIVFFSLYQLNYGKYYSKVTKPQAREVLFELAKEKEKIPAYDILFFGYTLPSYQKMLKINTDVQTNGSFYKKIKNHSIEESFFILDVHPGDHISKIKVLQDKSVKKVLEIKKHGARAVLYAYNTNPFSFGGLNIDFNKCNLSKPYKGNPLGMYWPGSVTTPVYELDKNKYDLIINTKGTKAYEQYAKLKIQVFKMKKGENSLLVEKTVDTKQDFTDFTVPFKIKQDDNISFVVSFINDKSDPKTKEDRNIYLKSIILKKQ